MDLQLSGNTALVMAASKGIGREIATQLASEGAHVAISSRSLENLEAAREYIVETADVDPDMITLVPCDLSNPDEIRPAVKDAIDKLGGLDHLITNHGGTTPKQFKDATIGEFDEHYTSILKSTILVIKAALPALEASNGSMTHIVAATALEPPKGLIFTSTIRSGIFGLSKSIANEHAEDGIRSNCVCPRSIHTGRIEAKTEMIAERDNTSFEKLIQERKDALPVSRLGSPKEFARTATYVASPAAGFLTGTVVPVDGGWSKKAF